MEPDPNLERTIHKALRQLPEVPAPKTLMPCVLAALAVREQVPWRRQAWWHWPLTAKMAFVALALVAGGLITGSGMWLGDGVSAYTQQVSERVAPITSRWEGLTSLETYWSAFSANANPSLLLYGLVFVGAMYLASVGLGTMCYRLALKRA